LLQQKAIAKQNSYIVTHKMSLGLLARDSIVDLTAFNRDEIKTQQRPSNDTTPAIPTTSAMHEIQEVKSSSATTKSRSSGLFGTSTTSTQQKEANPQQPPSIQFVGLLDDYYSDAYYNFDDDDDVHRPHFLLGGPQIENRSNGGDNAKRFLCCLFPWFIQPPANKALQIERSISIDNSNHSRILPLPNTNDKDHQQSMQTTNEIDAESKDNESTNSNILGERLSDKERQAVLARLRLAQPESVTASVQQHQQQAGTTTSEQLDDASLRNGKHRNKGLLNGIFGSETSQLNAPTQIKGILKTRSTTKVEEQGQQNATFETRLSTISDTGSSTSNISENNKNVVPPANGGTRRRSLFPSYEEKKPRTTNSVSFSPMARVVTVTSRNDMTTEEKSDIWWQKNDYEDFRKTGRIITKAMLEGGGEIWLAGGTADASSKKKKNEEYVNAKDTGDKWWHKFGHSRRGLEHVVSIEEGRQRQMNVKVAIRAVLDEQSRQKMYRKEDAEKLRHVSLQHTMWARDLALASGASDADAVDQSFSEGRKSREFFLLKMSRNKAPTGSVKLDPKNVPQFMQPALGTRPLTARLNTNIVPQNLDAHTASQIQFRRQKQQLDPTIASQAVQEKDVESQEQVHDPRPDEATKSSLAQKAAGFSADNEKVNMAAVLSGMGGAILNQKNESLPTMRVVS
jgi:hypothetical protein